LALAILTSGCSVAGFNLAESQMKAVQAAVQATVAASAPQTAGSVAAATPTTAESMNHAASAANAATTTLTSTGASQNQADLGEPNVMIMLKTGTGDGKMAFIGMGGELDGKVNPDIKVNPGDVVEITLEDGDNLQHNLALPDFGIQSQDVFKEGDQVKVKFKAEKEGVYPYFCAMPGHRAAGMEGRLIVGNPAEITGVMAPDVSRPPDDLPGPLARTGPEHVRIDLEAVEVEGRLADGAAYTFWTFGGKVPGPFLRIRVGDTVDVHLRNPSTNTMQHSVDFHAVTGPGGGAVFTQSKPGEETMFTFKALNPGLFVYHCASPMIPHHISNGMYGLILVEPEGGLPPVDKEFYVMQGEIYTAEPFGSLGKLTFNEEKLLNERPEYFILNGSVGALTALHPLQAKVGDTVRIFYGVGGPNFTSAFHVIGEIFDRVYNQASLTAPPLTDVQTTLVPPGGATVVEFKIEVPGRYLLVDHALSRLQRGLAGFLIAEGPDAPEIFQGTPTAGSGH
jgi:nitrite reductase (NO-forming)